MAKTQKTITSALRSYKKLEKEIEQLQKPIKSILQQIEQLKRKKKEEKKFILKHIKEIPPEWKVEVKHVTVPAYEYDTITVTYVGKQIQPDEEETKPTAQPVATTQQPTTVPQPQPLILTPQQANSLKYNGNGKNNGIIAPVVNTSKYDQPIADTKPPFLD